MAVTAGWDIAAAVRAAEKRIRPFVRQTPVESSVRFGELVGCRALVKLENLQHTGSFKIRGALSALLALDTRARERGVVAASTGNHGAAVAFAARRLGSRATVYVPRSASATKVDAIRRLGGEVIIHGDDGIEAEIRARRDAGRAEMTYVSPYNDPAVVGGQGTIGVELERQVEDFDALFVAVGGGGLVSGVAGYLAERRPGVRIVGCSPENSAVMDASVRAGRVLEIESKATLSDGTAGGVESSAITLEPCRLLVDDWIRVSEGEIRAAMLEFIEAHHLLVEGSAGVALAAFLKAATNLGVERGVIVACGGNISLETLRCVLERQSRA